MSVQLSSRIEINNQATLSADSRTIMHALKIDGVWYDIDLDFAQKNSLDLIVPKIQTIWAHIAEQAFSSNDPPEIMECSYNPQTETASLTLGKRDITSLISFDVEQLQNELGESQEIVENYFGKGTTCTVHQVMKYISCQGMSAHLIQNNSSIPKHILTSSLSTPASSEAVIKRLREAAEAAVIAARIAESELLN